MLHGVSTVFLNNAHDKQQAFSDVLCQMDLPTKHITLNKLNQEIPLLNVKKSPGFDKIYTIVIKALPKNDILLLTFFFLT